MGEGRPYCRLSAPHNVEAGALISCASLLTTQYKLRVTYRVRQHKQTCKSLLSGVTPRTHMVLTFSPNHWINVATMMQFFQLLTDLLGPGQILLSHSTAQTDTPAWTSAPRPSISFPHLYVAVRTCSTHAPTHPAPHPLPLTSLTASM